MIFQMKMTMPAAAMTAAVKAARDAVSMKRSLMKQIADMGSESDALTNYGQRGVEDWKEKHQALMAEMEKINSEALEAINGFEESAAGTLSSQITLDGEILHSADAELLNAGLVNTADEVQAIAERNKDNYTMLRALQSYSDRKGLDWHFADKATSADRYTKNLFDNLKAAVTYPDGLASMQYIDQNGEFRRIAVNEDLVDCFADGALDEMESA